MAAVTDPTGADYWWHMSAVEQQMWRQAQEGKARLRRQLQLLDYEVRQLRLVATNRCRALPDHSHSMRGVIWGNSLPSDES